MIITGSEITTTKTLIEGAMVKRSFRKSALLPSSAVDTHHDIFMRTDTEKHTSGLKKHVFDSK